MAKRRKTLEAMVTVSMAAKTATRGLKGMKQIHFMAFSVMAKKKATTKKVVKAMVKSPTKTTTEGLPFKTNPKTFWHLQLWPREEREKPFQRIRQRRRPKIW